MKKVFNKLDKLMSLLFESLIYYMFFVLGYVTIVFGIMYKPLGICGIIIGVLILIAEILKDKNAEE